MNKKLLMVMQIGLFTALLAGSALAQAPSPDVQLAEMMKLNFLVGEWRGEGWAMIRQGSREAAKQTETV